MASYRRPSTKQPDPDPSFSEAGEEYDASEFGGFKDYLRRKRIKLQNQDSTVRSRHSTADIPQMFKSYVMASLGYTNPNSNILRQMVVKHGGVWREFGVGGFTVVIATSIPAKKREELKRYLIVKPEWIGECIKQGKIVECTKYRVVGEGEGQAILNFDGRVEKPKTGSSYKDVAGEDMVRLALETVRVPTRKSAKWEIPTSDDDGKLGEDYEEKTAAAEAPRGQPLTPMPAEEDEAPPCGQPSSIDEEYFGDDDETLWMQDPDGWLAPPSHQPERQYRSEGEEAENEEVDLVRLVPTTPEAPATVSFISDQPATISFLSDQPAIDHVSPMLPAPRNPIESQSSLEMQESKLPPPTGKINGVDAYEAEAIIGEKKHPANKKPRNKRGKLRLLVKWRGYNEREATWEWEDTLREDLGDEVVDEMCTRYRAKKAVKGSGKGTQKSSQKSRKSSQPALSASRQKIFSQVTKSSSQSSTKENNRKASAAEEIMVQPSRGRAMETALPAGFEFMPESFSTVNLSDTDVDDQRTPYQCLERLPPSSQIRRGGFSQTDGLPTSYQLPVVDEEDLSSTDTVVPTKGLQSEVIGEEGTPDSYQLAVKGNEEAKCSFPQLPLDKAPEFGILGSMEIPTSFSSIQLSSDIEPLENHANIPSSVRSVKKDGQKRPHPTESPTPTPKKARYSNAGFASQEASISSREPVSRKKSPKITKEIAKTPEEFNEIFLSEPRVRAASVLNPEFLSTFFKESRLHYLSTWKAELRSRLQDLAQRSLQPVPPESRPIRYVMHVDFDCFFAAVSTRDRPDLKDKPVAICHGKSENSMSSEIASCNYVARKFGVKNGMWMASAKILCPGIITLGYDFEKYEEASEAFYGVILSLGGERLQAVSVDEALVDISNLVCNDHYSDADREEAMAQRLATKVRDECRRRTGCEVSVGIGINVVTARLALKKAKPAGQYIVRRTEVQDFLDELKIGAFLGIGDHTVSKIVEKFGSDLVSQVRKIERGRLKQTLGAKTGLRVYELCRGIDGTLVGATETLRESISISVNWGVRFTQKEQAEEFLHRLASAVEDRMKSEGVKGRILNFKVAKRAPDAPFETEKFLGCGKVDEMSRTFVFGVPTSDAKLIVRKCVELLRGFHVSPGDIRGLGIGMKGLEDDTNDDGQQQLKFRPAAVGKEEETNVEKRPKPAPPPPPELKPAAPIKFTAYVKPKPLTLLDAFSKKADKKKANKKKEEAPGPVTAPTPAAEEAPVQHNVVLEPQQPEKISVQPKQHTPPIARNPTPPPLSPSPPLPPQENAPGYPAAASAYTLPKATKFLDRFTNRTHAKKKQQSQTPSSSTFSKPQPPANKKDPLPKSNAGIQKSIIQKKKPVAPVSPLPLSTQFEIPSPSQIDITCLPFLPAHLQELVLQQHRAREEVEREMALPVEPDSELERPPNSQWDIGDWNTFTQGVRDEIRAEHEAQKAVEQKRALAREDMHSPSKQKKGVVFPCSSPKPKYPKSQQGAPKPPIDSAPIPFVLNGKNQNKHPPKPKQRHPTIYDRHGKEVSSWLFAPPETGGAGIDPEIFQFYDQSERARIVSAAVREHNTAAQKEAVIKAAEVRERERLQNAVRVKATRKRPVLCLAAGEELGSADVEAVRNTIRAWVRAVGEGVEVEDGDFEMLCGFLRAVVLDEGRVDKAAGIVRWFLGTCEGREGWAWVCDGVVEAVREAAKEKGISGLEF